jgi:hypothetical protein
LGDHFELALGLPDGSAIDVEGSIDADWKRVTEVAIWDVLSPADAVEALGDVVTAGQVFLEHG